MRSKVISHLFVAVAILIGYCSDHDCTVNTLNSMTERQYGSAKVYPCTTGADQPREQGYCIAYRVETNNPEHYPVLPSYEQELYK